MRIITDGGVADVPLPRAQAEDDGRLHVHGDDDLLRPTTGARHRVQSDGEEADDRRPTASGEGVAGSSSSSTSKYLGGGGGGSPEPPFLSPEPCTPQNKTTSNRKIWPCIVTPSSAIFFYYVRWRMISGVFAVTELWYPVPWRMISGAMTELWHPVPWRMISGAMTELWYPVRWRMLSGVMTELWYPVRWRMLSGYDDGRCPVSAGVLDDGDREPGGWDALQDERARRHQQPAWETTRLLHRLRLQLRHRQPLEHRLRGIN